ncbi:hypothetical protein CDD83_8996 [Cordyceps sp. RAO-2017]|nr:hypothetical protein CDD83_8996 [Cordyceps sp. RAO-2017]
MMTPGQHDAWLSAQTQVDVVGRLCEDALLAPALINGDLSRLVPEAYSCGAPVASCGAALWLHPFDTQAFPDRPRWGPALPRPPAVEDEMGLTPVKERWDRVWAQTKCLKLSLDRGHGSRRTTPQGSLADTRVRLHLNADSIAAEPDRGLVEGRIFFNVLRFLSFRSETDPRALGPDNSIWTPDGQFRTWLIDRFMSRGTLWLGRYRGYGLDVDAEERCAAAPASGASMGKAPEKAKKKSILERQMARYFLSNMPCCLADLVSHRGWSAKDESERARGLVPRPGYGPESGVRETGRADGDDNGGDPRRGASDSYAGARAC